MIRNNAEYQKSLRLLKAQEQRIEAQKNELLQSGLGQEEIKRATDPLTSFHLGLLEEIEAYELQFD